jgi:hypothetical protein
MLLKRGADLRAAEADCRSASLNKQDCVNLDASDRVFPEISPDMRRQNVPLEMRFDSVLKILTKR